MTGPEDDTSWLEDVQVPSSGASESVSSIPWCSQQNKGRKKTRKKYDPEMAEDDPGPTHCIFIGRIAAPPFITGGHGGWVGRKISASWLQKGEIDEGVYLAEIGLHGVGEEESDSTSEDGDTLAESDVDNFRRVRIPPPVQNKPRQEKHPRKRTKSSRTKSKISTPTNPIFQASSSWSAQQSAALFSAQVRLTRTQLTGARVR